jgi:signal transduction histidine kinase
MFSKLWTNLNKSLLLRLTLLHALTFVVLASVFFGVFYARLTREAVERMDEELADDMRVYAAAARKAGPPGLREAIAQIVETEDPREEFYRLLDLEGRTLAASDLSSWGEIPSGEALARLKDNSRRPVFQTLSVPGEDYGARMISAVIAEGVVLQLGESLEEIDDFLEIFLRLFAVLIFVLILVSALTGGLLARFALRDLNLVTLTAEEISSGGYDRRVPVRERFREIEILGRTFNRMLDRIHGLLKSMREINDNIAHDLRSPLARIRGIAEMTLVADKPIEDFREMATSTVEECDTLIGIVDTMLDITEVEAGVSTPQRQEFDLAALIRGACELFSPLAGEKGIALTAELPESLAIESDKKRMQRIVTNILENALKYTPEKGSVRISAVAVAGEVRLDFADTGIGISAGDLPHIFERFYRGDRSRARGGVGLGLSLVKAYTESLNGTIAVASAVDQGCTFTLRFKH